MHIKKERSQNRRIEKGTKTNLRIRKKTSRRHLRRTIRPKKKKKAKTSNKTEREDTFQNAHKKTSARNRRVRA